MAPRYLVFLAGTWLLCSRPGQHGINGADSVLSLDTSTNTRLPTEGVTGLLYVTSLAVGPDAHTFYLVGNGSLQIVGF